MMLLLLLACTPSPSRAPALALPEPTRVLTGELSPTGTAPDVATIERGDVMVVWRDGAGRPAVRKVDPSLSRSGPVVLLGEEPVTAGPVVARYPGGAVALWGTADAVHIARLNGRGEPAGLHHRLPVAGPVDGIDVATWMTGALVPVWTAAGRAEGARLETLVAPAEGLVTLPFVIGEAGAGLAVAEALDGGVWVAFNRGDLQLVHVRRDGSLEEATPVGDADPTPAVAAQGIGAVAAGRKLPGLDDIAPVELRLSGDETTLVAAWTAGGLFVRAWAEGQALWSAEPVPLPEDVRVRAPALAAGRDGLWFLAWEQEQADGPAIAARRVQIRASDASVR